MEKVTIIPSGQTEQIHSGKLGVCVFYSVSIVYSVPTNHGHLADDVIHRCLLRENFCSPHVCEGVVSAFGKISNSIYEGKMTRSSLRSYGIDVARSAGFLVLERGRLGAVYSFNTNTRVLGGIFIADLRNIKRKQRRDHWNGRFISLSFLTRAGFHHSRLLECSM
uniref:Uncharacterized protein n=1 Tax=Schistocephalus solidus TaxID=70667 RepID=A0A0X3P0Q9_SCHSO